MWARSCTVADELKRKAAARELEIDTQWKDRLDEAIRKAAAERELLSANWNARLSAAQDEAAARYRALQVRGLMSALLLSLSVQESTWCCRTCLIVSRS